MKKETASWHLKQAQKCLNRIEQLHGKHPEVFTRLKKKMKRHVIAAQGISSQK